MSYIKKIPFFLTIISFLTFFTSANAEVKVVASIKPIHSLASYLMDGIGKPDLIVDGYASPHGFAMKPSHAKMLQEADIIFWVGEDLENFLEQSVQEYLQNKIVFSKQQNIQVDLLQTQHQFQQIMLV